ncbi:MotA/TolQ/ExbB proton channel family protein [Candidatus Sumerlaeota bacterium]|nr:MotA/TolQ/ExbB proton channel family protein [Candidatus Sumerlaeota bacterium]
MTSALPVVLGSANWLGVDIVSAVRNCDLVGLLCLIALALFSVFSWIIIGYKLLHVGQAQRQTDDFVETCMTAGGNLESAYKSAAGYPDSPLAQIMREAYLELQIENWYEGDTRVTLEHQLALARAGLERVIERATQSEIKHLEGYLIFLATTASVCPFIGLFGTVWGVQAAFQSLAIAGSADITALAPGISTALVTTVAGLIAAIPAVVSYNYLNNKIQHLITRMDSFGLELVNIVVKRIMQKSAR